MNINCPKHRKKRIYWHEGRGKGVILVGYCPDTLAYFIAMTEEARKDFEIDYANVTCGRVRWPSSMLHFTFIMFDIDGPQRGVDGWDSCNSCFEY